MSRWFLHFIVKCLITLLCALTLNYTLGAVYFHREPSVLLIATILLILMVKVWSFDYKKNDSREHDNE